MRNSKPALGFLLARAKSFSNSFCYRTLPSCSSSSSSSSFRANNPLLTLLLLLPPHSSISHGLFLIPNRRFCGYAAEQFSDDEYECDFENHQVFLFFPLLDCNLLVFIVELLVVFDF